MSIERRIRNKLLEMQKKAEINLKDNFSRSGQKTHGTMSMEVS